MANEIGYINIIDADIYFSTRLSADAWTSIVKTSGDPIKTAALQTAYDRLFYSGLFGLPPLALATAAQLVILQKFQCEMALYMLIHLAGEDRRKGLQAQGVIQAGVVKETYSDADLNKLPIPAFVSAGLAAFSMAPAPFYVSKVDRDEEDEDMIL